MPTRLILTHILQTEVKNKMSALKKGLQREPAFPDGSPSGFIASMSRAGTPTDNPYAERVNFEIPWAESGV
jgi:transposase InsO family protein